MRTITILFGTESGNAQGLAARAGDVLGKAGFSPKIVDMMDFGGQALPSLELVLVITSTYGNGDPPSNAEKLHLFLMKECPPLPGVRFSVCALGDTTYDRFAQCGKDFDRRLEELGAVRLHPRKDCDVDYDDAFDEWLAGVTEAFGAYQSTAGEEPAAAATPVVEKAAEVPDAPATRRNPVLARVKENFDLHRTGSEKETRHLALETDLPFELGDSIGVWPTNEPELVARVIQATGTSADDQVTIGGATMRLEDALSTKLEIVQADARVVEKAFGAVSSEERRAILGTHHLIDILEEKKPVLTAADLVDLLRPLSPRPYSIASSKLLHPGEVHLAVAVLRYDLFGSRRGGVASRYLADRATPGTSVPIFLHPSPRFRLVSRDQDIVMIGPGTGVAPFRSFLEERSLTPGKGRSWLFFGARHEKTDYLYQSDFESLLADKTLTQLDLAFSRDTESKVYVQHRMLEARKELYAWIESGAALYVCGDASKMAPDVDAALVQILASEGKLSEEAAKARLTEWHASGRYQKDVY